MTHLDSQQQDCETPDSNILTSGLISSGLKQFLNCPPRHFKGPGIKLNAFHGQKMKIDNFDVPVGMQCYATF